MLRGQEASRADGVNLDREPDEESKALPCTCLTKTSAGSASHLCFEVFSPHAVRGARAPARKGGTLHNPPIVQPRTKSF